MKNWTKKFGVRVLLQGVFWISAFLPISRAFSATVSTDRAPLFLEVGEQRSLEFPTLLRFSVSGDAIRYVRLKEKNRILIKAVKPGVAQLEVLEGDSPARSTLSTRLIRVEQRKAHSRNADLLQAISRLQDLEVIDSGKRFVVRGSVKNVREANAVAELRDQYPDLILDETEIEPKWLDEIRPRLRTLLAAYPHAKAEVLESGIAVRGSVSSPESQHNLQRQVRAVMPLARFDLQTVQTNNATLYFKIYLLEMKRETLRSLGVKWPDAHASSLQVATFDTGWALSGPTKIDLSVQAMSQKGQLRILSSPELVVRCPGQAELFAGGELPIRQRSKYNDNITWKNFGLSLKLDTKEYNGDKVRLNIETELSHLEPSQSGDDIPTVKANRIKTQVDALMSRPLFLSGLLQEDWQKSVRGLPGLSDIPILGALFGSEDFQSRRSELVAILVPSREPPAEPVTRLQSGIPKGFLPLPRAPLSGDEIEELKASSDYPWNALK